MTSTLTYPPSPAGIATDSVIQCVGLTKVFRDFWLRNRVRAVDGIDFQVKRGQVFGLLGPNGSGKSTTIKMILGLLYPSAGRVTVLEKRPEDVAVKRLIGYLPEESYLYRFLNARETLDYYGRLFSLPRRTRVKRIDELLEQVGLVHAQHRPVGQYSKGMQRKIGLAQALINRPQLLILDEPTSGMDPTATHDTKQLLQYLAARGTTILLCSHLLADAEELCQHVAMMYGGKIIRQGTMDELLTNRNRTTIETDRLDEKAIEQIDNLLLSRGRKIETVSHPRQSLEQWFIERIKEQQAQGAETSGAVSGGKMAEFLVGPNAEAAQGQEVIGQLVRAAAPPPDEIPKPAAPPKPQAPPPDEVLLAKLLRPVKPAAPRPAEDVEFIDHLAGVESTDSSSDGPAPILPLVPPNPPAKSGGPAPGPAHNAAAAFDQPPTAEELNIIDSLVTKSWGAAETKADAPAPAESSAAPEPTVPSPPPDQTGKAGPGSGSPASADEKPFGGFLDAMSHVKPEDDVQEKKE